MKTSSYRQLRLLACATLALALAPLHAETEAPSTAAAAPPSPLVGTLAAFLVTPGNEMTPDSLTPVERVEPGQVVEYALTYTNQSESTLRTIGIDGPVPPEAIFVDGSARAVSGQTVLFSVDGGINFSPPPVKYTVELEDGTREERIATPDLYNRIRWIVPELTPAANVKLTYRVRIR